jgi:hypothetical protein
MLHYVQVVPDIATCMYYTGLDPFTRQEVHVARGLRDRKMQRALTQLFKPENYFIVREALLKAGRGDLIGNGCDCLIPAHPRKAAIEARKRRANEVAEGDHYHSIANPAKGEPVGERDLPNPGYRAGRRRARRQYKRPGRDGGGLGPSS